MAKLNSKNLDLKSLFDSASKNLTWLFFAGFLLLIFFEFFVINNSVQIVFNANNEQAPVTKEHGLRVDFAGYDEVVKRINNGGNFVPSGSLSQDPFNPGAATSPTATTTPVSTSTPQHP